MGTPERPLAGSPKWVQSLITPAKSVHDTECSSWWFFSIACYLLVCLVQVMTDDNTSDLAQISLQIQPLIDLKPSHTAMRHCWLVWDWTQSNSLVLVAIQSLEMTLPWGPTKTFCNLELAKESTRSSGAFNHKHDTVVGIVLSFNVYIKSHRYSQLRPNVCEPAFLLILLLL